MNNSPSLPSMTLCIKENTQKDDPSLATSTALNAMLTSENILIVNQVHRLLKERLQQAFYLSVNVPNDHPSHKVLIRGLRILKSKLPKKLPDQELLAQWLEFIKEMQSKSPNPSVMKISQHLISFISKHLRESKALLKVHLPSYRMTMNILNARNRVKNAPKKKKMVALLYCPIFGNHVQTIQNGKREIEYNDTIAFPPLPPDQEIQETQKLKLKELLEKKPELNSLFEEKPTKQLQYKYYSDQEPLELKEEQLDEVFNCVIEMNENNPAQKEAFVLASQIVVKIMVDQYCTGDQDSMQQLLSVFLEMLSSKSPEKQMEAFDLLLNLSLHIHLLEEIWPKLNAQTTASTSQMQQENQQQHQVEEVGNLRVGVLMDELFDKLKEMLLWLVHDHLQDTQVWTTALKCFLAMTMSDGYLDKHKLLSIDPRVYLYFWKYAEKESYLVQYQLNQMLINVLYNRSSDQLNFDNLFLLGGIDFIIDLYKNASSVDLRDSLFAILYDFLIWEISTTKNMQIPAEQAQLILEFLKSLNSGQYLVSVFKHVPDRFVEHFVRFIYFEELKKDPEWFKAFANLDKAILVAILYDMEKNAKLHNKLALEFEKYLEKNLRENAFEKSDLELLNSLLYSQREEERKHGSLWLFQLLSQIDFQQPKDIQSPFAKETLTILYQLLTSKHPEIRKLYLIITEKLLLNFRYLMEPSLETMNQLFLMLNEHLLRVVSAGELDLDNLLFCIQLIFDFITIPSSEKASYEMESPFCSLFESILKGKFIIKTSLLEKLNIQIIFYLFNHLPNDSLKTQHVKPMLLYLLIELYQDCLRKNREDSIGGMNFFKELVASENALISFIASQYLIEQLANEKPAQYQALISKLANKLKISQEQLKKNPYLEIKSIMGLSREKSGHER